MIHLNLTRRTLGLLVVGCLFGSGCDHKDANRGAIGGEVTLDGTPIVQGSILFVPIEGTQGAVTGGPIENGRYQLVGNVGPAIGWNRVEIHAPRKTGKMIPKGLGGTGEMVDEQVDAVAPSFNAASMLKVEVKPGDNTANFEVVAK